MWNLFHIRFFPPTKNLVFVKEITRMFKGKLTLGDIGVSFLLPEKLLFGTLASSTFPTFKLLLSTDDVDGGGGQNWIEWRCMGGIQVS